jgi:hypothetical protein
MERVRGLIWLTVTALLLIPARARAQQAVTVMPGVLHFDGTRPSIDLAYGYGPSSRVSLEIDYFGTTGPRSGDHPYGAGILLNIVVDSKRTGRLQYFGTGGLAYWVESLPNDQGGDVSGKNVGGGLKCWLIDHLAVRLDYRLIFVDRPNGSNRPRRLAAGLHAAF